MTLTQISSRGVEDALRWSLGAGGTNYYTFTGPGLTGTVNNPTIYLSRGHTYIFENNNSSNAHPFQIQSTSGQGGTAYNTGVTNNGGGGGSEIKITVPHGAPDILYYQCTAHANMGGTIYITGAVADGTITTAKIADDAITTAKIADDAITNDQLANACVHGHNIINGTITQLDIADNAVTTAKIQDQAITGLKIANGTITQLDLADGAVVGAKIADGAVVTTKIPDDAVTAAKIGAGACGTEQLADDAVTGAKIADDSITSAHLASNSVNTAELIDGAVSSAKIANNVIVNADINSSAAIDGTKINPDFGSQIISTTGNVHIDGELQPHWIGHQSQCTENTHNTTDYWKVAEVSGGGSEGGKIEFFGTDDYTGNNTNHQVGRTTLLLRVLTNNQLGGVFWSESGSYRAVYDIRWKYINGINYEIWIRKGPYNNVIPHVTGSFDYVQTFGSTTNSQSAPSGSTPFLEQYQCQVGGSNVFTVNSGDIIMQNKRVFSASGYSNMDVTFSHDAVCANDSGNGQWFWVVCGHTHYNHSYGTDRVAACHARGTTITTAHNVLNNTSTLGGSWSFSKPNNTTFRVTHNAGTYAYPGRYTVTVYSST